MGVLVRIVKSQGTTILDHADEAQRIVTGGQTTTLKQETDRKGEMATLHEDLILSLKPVKRDLELKTADQNQGLMTANLGIEEVDQEEKVNLEVIDHVGKDLVIVDLKSVMRDQDKRIEEVGPEQKMIGVSRDLHEIEGEIQERKYQPLVLNIQVNLEHHLANVQLTLARNLKTPDMITSSISSTLLEMIRSISSLTIRSGKSLMEQELELLKLKEKIL